MASHYLANFLSEPLGLGFYTLACLIFPILAIFVSLLRFVGKLPGMSLIANLANYLGKAAVASLLPLVVILARPRLSVDLIALVLVVALLILVPIWIKRFWRTALAMVVILILSLVVLDWILVDSDLRSEIDQMTELSISNPLPWFRQKAYGLRNFSDDLAAKSLLMLIGDIDSFDELKKDLRFELERELVPWDGTIPSPLG